MNKGLRIALGFIVAFFSFAIISQLLIAIGPVTAGLVIVAVDAAPDPQLAKTLESVGNIFVLIVSLYLSIKIYKKIANKKQTQNDTNETTEE